MSADPAEAKKLKRLLYLTELSKVFVSGNPEQYFLKDLNKKKELLSNLIKDCEQLVKILLEANKDDHLPRRVTLLYILAYALTETEEDDAKRELAKASLSICKTDEEFFKFVSIFTLFHKEHSKNKLTSLMANVTKKYFEAKTISEFAESVGKSKGYHGWKYKDLFKLSHYKSSSGAKLLLASYVFFGLERLKDQESDEMKKIYELLEKWEKLRKTENEKEASKLVKELQADFSHVNPRFIKSQEVWSAIVPQLPTREVLRLLPKFYKFGMLKGNSKVHDVVLESLSSLEKIKKCQLHPIEVFIHMKNFEKGGKPMDPHLEEYLKSKKEAGGDAKEVVDKTKTEPKCPTITLAISKCLKLAYPKDPHALGMGKKIVLALDVSQSSEPICFKNKNITCLEAELALTLYYFKTEKNVNVTVFNNKEVKGINLDKNAPFAQGLKKLKDSKSDYMSIPAVFDWAISKKKEVDVFICLIQNTASLHSAPKEERASWNAVKESFLKYQKKMSAPSSKLVAICLGSHNMAPIQGINALTICGFCPEIPNVVKSFVTGSFS